LLLNEDELVTLVGWGSLLASFAVERGALKLVALMSPLRKKEDAVVWVSDELELILWLEYLGVLAASTVDWYPVELTKVWYGQEVDVGELFARLPTALTVSAELFDRKIAGIELEHELLDASDTLVDKVVDRSPLVVIACRI